MATYLARRLGPQGLPAGLVQMLHQRTHGNPLFLVTMVDDLLRQGLLQEGKTGWELVGEVGCFVQFAALAASFAWWHQALPPGWLRWKAARPAWSPYRASPHRAVRRTTAP